MEKIYRSVDGKIFETDDECKRYENDLIKESIKDKVICWDNMGNVIPFDLDEACFMNITDEKSLKVVIWYGDEAGMPTPKTIGLSFYDFDLLDWIVLEGTK